MNEIVFTGVEFVAACTVGLCAIAAVFWVLVKVLTEYPFLFVGFAMLGLGVATVIWINEVVGAVIMIAAFVFLIISSGSEG